MAEIEFSVLSRSCLRQRLPDEEALGREVQTLVTERNTAQATINWPFNTHDARTKLHRSRVGRIDSRGTGPRCEYREGYACETRERRTVPQVQDPESGR